VPAVTKQEKARRSADTKTESASLGAFQAISISVPGSLELLPSAQFGYSITAEPLVIAAISFKVAGEKLVIEARKDFETKKPVKIVVRLPIIGKLETLGSVDVKSKVRCQ
jgi:Putative auto-transporter adhesin, head GIN domain